MKQTISQTCFFSEWNKFYKRKLEEEKSKRRRLTELAKRKTRYQSFAIKRAKATIYKISLKRSLGDFAYRGTGVEYPRGYKNKKLMNDFIRSGI